MHIRQYYYLYYGKDSLFGQSRDMAAIARQRCGKHVSASKNKKNAIGFLGVVFPILSVARICNEGQLDKRE
jgi:hypothetical protein